MGPDVSHYPPIQMEEKHKIHHENIQKTNIRLL